MATRRSANDFANNLQLYTDGLLVTLCSMLSAEILNPHKNCLGFLKSILGEAGRAVFAGMTIGDVLSHGVTALESLVLMHKRQCRASLRSVCSECATSPEPMSSHSTS